MLKSILLLWMFFQIDAVLSFIVLDEPVLVQYNEREKFYANLTYTRVPNFINFNAILYVCEGKTNNCEEVLKLSLSPIEASTRYFLWTVNVPGYWDDHTLEVALVLDNGISCKRNLDTNNQKLVHFSKLKVKHDHASSLKYDLYMDWGGSCSNINSIEMDKQRRNSAPYCDFPLVSPTTLESNGNSYAVFTCTSRCGEHEQLTWYQEKGDIRKPIYTNGINSNVKQLILNKTLGKSDQGSYIYCESSSFFSKSYEKILLSFTLDRNTTTPSEDSSTVAEVKSESASDILVPIVSGCVAVLILITLLAVIFKKFRSRTKPPKIEEKIYYATTGVTYAILDLEPPSSNNTPPMKNSTPYTEIIGAYKPKGHVGF